jgi:hypothetical protein
VQAIWTAPTGLQVEQPVTLDATRSTGTAPLSCTWSFQSQDGAIVWETRTGCRLRKAFHYPGTKYVELTVRDADGDTAANRQSFSVAAG